MKDPLKTYLLEASDKFVHPASHIQHTFDESLLHAFSLWPSGKKHPSFKFEKQWECHFPGSITYGDSPLVALYHCAVIEQYWDAQNGFVGEELYMRVIRFLSQFVKVTDYPVVAIENELAEVDYSTESGLG